MSARRSSHPAVQLFPFLAVLMCALGALILLLLVTTSHVREQARTRARLARIAAAKERAERLQTEQTEPPARDRWQPSALPPAAALQPAPATADTAPGPSLREQWQQTVADLQEAARREDAQLQSHRHAAASEESELKALLAKIAALREAAEQLAHRESEAEAELEQSAAHSDELQQTVSEQESALADLKVRRAAAQSKYCILPYDGRSGTVRRPIYIECTESGLKFASENILLTPEQLDGFPALRNPLLAGADALIDYWSLQARKNPAENGASAPYVLLIVRPSGTVGYYVARRMLESLGQPFGYELISEDMQLQYPTTDPDAVKTCQAAINEVLKNPDRIAMRGGVVAPGSLEPMSVSDGSGKFALEEVNQLRGSGRTVHFGGRDFDRNSAARGSPSYPSGRRTATAGGGTDGAQSSGSAPTPFLGPTDAAGGTPGGSGLSPLGVAGGNGGQGLPDGGGGLPVGSGLPTRGAVGGDGSGGTSNGGNGLPGASGLPNGGFAGGNDGARSPGSRSGSVAGSGSGTASESPGTSDAAVAGGGAGAPSRGGKPFGGLFSWLRGSGASGDGAGSAGGSGTGTAGIPSSGNGAGGFGSGSPVRGSATGGSGTGATNGWSPSFGTAGNGTGSGAAGESPVTGGGAGGNDQETPGTAAAPGTTAVAGNAGVRGTPGTGIAANGRRSPAVSSTPGTAAMTGAAGAPGTTGQTVNAPATGANQQGTPGQVGSADPRVAFTDDNSQGSTATAGDTSGGAMTTTERYPVPGALGRSGATTGGTGAVSSGGGLSTVFAPDDKLGVPTPYERPSKGAPRGAPPNLASRSIANEAAAGFSEAAGRAPHATNEQNATAADQPGDLSAATASSLAAIAEARKNLPHVAPANPAEGLLMPGSQIGLERKVVIRVSSHQLIVDSELPITVAPGTSREDLQDQLAEALRMHFAGWEQPPSGFYWLPLVRFAVLPGGQQFAKRLTDLTNDWEIKSKVDFVLE
ncbi:MAG: hypothetical protein U0992_02075 [Planctomycetaceae bacterium]